jgi:hypothetical protein
MTHKLIDLGQGRFQYRSYSFEIKPALRRPAERIWNLSIPGINAGRRYRTFASAKMIAVTLIDQEIDAARRHSPDLKSSSSCINVRNAFLWMTSHSRFNNTSIRPKKRRPDDRRAAIRNPDQITERDRDAPSSGPKYK